MRSLSDLQNRSEVDPNPTPEELAARRAYWSDISAAIGEHGEPGAAQSPDCSTCGGLGWVSYRKYENGVYVGTEARACNNPNCPVVQARYAERYASLVSMAQIPIEYEALTFTEWGELDDDTLIGKIDALDAARAFAAARNSGFRFLIPAASASPKCSIVFAGANGVGKTSLAASIASTLLQEGVPVKYALAGELFGALTERFDHEKDEFEYEPEQGDQASVMRLYQNVPVLILDELPRPPGKSDWWKDQLYQLINHRYIHQMPTVITTNLNPATLEAAWGMTISTRILAMAFWIEMSGLDMRTALAGNVVVSR